jgi:mono/diheme cytochrome c family protein
MKRFSPVFVLSALLFVTCVLTGVAASQVSSAKVQRGKYLVVEVAHCGDCHTPMNEKGEPLTGKWMQGTALTFKPMAPMPWSDASPNIAGLPRWKTREAVGFLMNGKLNGQGPKPPMPEYHLARRDAEAMVAYLKSLPPPK